MINDGDSGTCGIINSPGGVEVQAVGGVNTSKVGVGVFTDHRCTDRVERKRTSVEGPTTQGDGRTGHVR